MSYQITRLYYDGEHYYYDESIESWTAFYRFATDYYSLAEVKQKIKQLRKEYEDAVIFYDCLR